MEVEAAGRCHVGGIGKALLRQLVESPIDRNGRDGIDCRSPAGAGAHN